MKNRINHFRQSTTKRLKEMELTLPIFSKNEKTLLLTAYNNLQFTSKEKYPFEIFEIMIGELMVVKNESIERAINKIGNK